MHPCYPRSASKAEHDYYKEYKSIANQISTSLPWDRMIAENQALAFNPTSYTSGEGDGKTHFGGISAGGSAPSSPSSGADPKSVC